MVDAVGPFPTKEERSIIESGFRRAFREASNRRVPLDERSECFTKEGKINWDKLI